MASRWWNRPIPINMASIQFEVIDVACEQADQSFFVPQVLMTTKSTTQNAVMHGWREFIPSVPPKTYLKATISGVSERIGFTAEENPRMCAGAEYTYTGTGEYDVKGVLIQSYSKKFFAQCSKQFWPPVPSLQLNPFAQVPCPVNTNCQFIGYCWTPDARSCSVCDPNIVNWPFIGDVTANVLALDLSGFLVHPNDVTITHNTYAASSNFAAFCSIEVPKGLNIVRSGHTYPFVVGSQTLIAESAFVDPPVVFPIVFVDNFFGAYINWVDATNLTCVLSREYLDSEALANAQIVVGTGATAATTPRTTGYVSVFTTVVYTLLMSNLIVGQNYVVTVDLWEQGPNVNTHTPKQYSFTAGQTTYSIVDIIPTPVATHTITVQSPKIAFQQ